MLIPWSYSVGYFVNFLVIFGYIWEEIIFLKGLVKFRKIAYWRFNEGLNWNLKLEIGGRTPNSSPATWSALVGSQLSSGVSKHFFNISIPTLTPSNFLDLGRKWANNGGFFCRCMTFFLCLLNSLHELFFLSFYLAGIFFGFFPTLPSLSLFQWSVPNHPYIRKNIYGLNWTIGAQWLKPLKNILSQVFSLIIWEECG